MWQVTHNTCFISCNESLCSLLEALYRDELMFNSVLINLSFLLVPGRLFSHEWTCRFIDINLYTYIFLCVKMWGSRMKSEGGERIGNEAVSFEELHSPSNVQLLQLGAALFFSVWFISSRMIIMDYKFDVLIWHFIIMIFSTNFASSTKISYASGNIFFSGVYTVSSTLGPND